jgi:hypothetical protein
MQERSPSASQNELSNQIKGIAGAVRGKVSDEINLNGCTSPKIQQLLNLYKMHASMRF